MVNYKTIPVKPKNYNFFSDLRSDTECTWDGMMDKFKEAAKKADIETRGDFVRFLNDLDEMYNDGGEEEND